MAKYIKCDVGYYLLFQGRLVKCIGYVTGAKDLILETVEDQKCPHCQESIGQEQFHVVESSRLFQEGAEPIKTI